MQHKNIVVFGITGSIGGSTLKILEAFPENFTLIGCSAGENIGKLNEITPKFTSIKAVSVKEESLISNTNGDFEKYSGEAGLYKLLDLKPDMIVMALSGKSGWKITIEAVKRGIPIALANKESLLIAGFFLGREITSDRKKIIPVDSEHAAVMQLLENSKIENIKKIYITASGGALRNMSKESAWNAGAKEALNHPVWDMGAKVTVDSATMLNKGMELIEAYWLFPFEASELGVIVHPEVAVHAAAEFVDGSFIAQIAKSDMAIPIAAALSYPEMLPVIDRIPEMAVAISPKTLAFSAPDYEKYPMLKLAVDLLFEKDFASMVAYAISDEVAVEKFLKNEIKISGIHKIVTESVEKFKKRLKPENIEEIEQMILEIEKFADTVICS